MENLLTIEMMREMVQRPAMLRMMIIQNMRMIVPDADTNPMMQQFHLLKDSDVVPHVLEMIRATPIDKAREIMTEQTGASGDVADKACEALQSFTTLLEQAYAEQNLTK